MSASRHSGARRRIFRLAETAFGEIGIATPETQPSDSSEGGLLKTPRCRRWFRQSPINLRTTPSSSPGWAMENITAATIHDGVASKVNSGNSFVNLPGRSS
jgi:hypothetical protein